MTVDANRRLTRELAEFLAISPKGKIKRFILEAESAPAEHHILRCVYQYRIGRSHTIADRKGDKAAVDLHRILQLLFKHLLGECADIKLGQLGFSGPEGSRRHYDCDTDRKSTLLNSSH